MSAGIGWHRWGPSWLDWTAFAAIILGTALLVSNALEGDPKVGIHELTDPEIVAFAHIGPAWYLAFPDTNDFAEGLSILIIGAFAPAVFLYDYVFLDRFGNVKVTILAFALCAATVFLLSFIGLRRDRAARNPLHGLLPD